MRAFITGIGGFVGPHLARHLLDCGDVVAGSTKSATGEHPLPYGDETVRLESVAWDLSRSPSSEFVAFLERFAPTVIYHLAACSVPLGSVTAEQADTAWRVNVAATADLARLAARCSSRPRLVFVSTSHVYAAPAEHSPFVDEAAPLAPLNPYGRSKLAAEQDVARAVRDDGLDAVIVRAFKHVGPGQSPEFMLPQWARQFAERSGRPVEVRNLDSWFDVTDVRDVVRAYRLVAERAASGAVLNVGSGTARRSGDLFESLRRLADPARAYVETQPGRRQESIADCRRLVALTGWRPEIPLDQTVADVWREWR